MKRRKFLKYLGIGTAAAAVPAAVLSETATAHPAPEHNMANLSWPETRTDWTGHHLFSFNDFCCVKCNASRYMVEDGLIPAQCPDKPTYWVSQYHQNPVDESPFYGGAPDYIRAYKRELGKEMAKRLDELILGELTS